MNRGKVPYWSIDPSVDSFFISSKVSDITLVSASDTKEVVAHTYAKMGAEIAHKMAIDEVQSYVVVIQPPRPDKEFFRTDYTVVVIPNEIERLHERINELEQSLMLERRRNAISTWTGS